jgi:cobalt-zinc-cadmium efflux system outer membrane protein
MLSKVVIFVGLALLPVLAFAQPRQPVNPGGALTLADLEEIAQRGNPTLVQATMAVQAAQGRYVQAGLYPNPVIGYRGDEMGNEGRSGQQGAFVAQEFVTGNKLGLSQAVVSHEIAQARQTYEVQRRRVLNDVRAGFYAVLIAQQTMELNEQLRDTAQKGVEVAEKLQAAKEASRLDVLQAQVEVETATLRLDESRTRYEAAWRRLAAVLGQPVMTPSPLAGSATADIPNLTWETALGRLLAESPELARARAGVQRAQCAVARECAQRVPNVEVSATLQRDNATGSDITSVGVGIPLPIFNRNQGNISRAQAELISAQREVQRIELGMHDRLATVFQEYAAARRQFESYSTRIVPNAKASYELVEAGRRHGEFDSTRFLVAQRTYFQAKLAELDSVGRLRDSGVTIEGLLLRGGLQESLAPAERSSGETKSSGLVGATAE